MLGTTFKNTNKNKQTKNNQATTTPPPPQKKATIKAQTNKYTPKQTKNNKS